MTRPTRKRDEQDRIGAADELPLAARRPIVPQARAATLKPRGPGGRS